MSQLRAFDVPRARKRLIVRPGQRAWWGVDPSTKRIAIGYVLPDTARGGAVRSIEQLAGAPRLEAIRVGTRELIDDVLLSSRQSPGVIVVEEPAGFGKRPNPELAYAVGATLCGIAGAFPTTRVEFVASSKWKLDVCGYGAISKPKPTERQAYAVLEWAQSVGYQGTSWDEADSWAIAEYARGAYELEQRGVSTPV